jgi:hypothetical protein
MKKVIELNEKELLTISGGESFAYRAGQFLAIAIDMGDGYTTSYAGAKAWNDWFGE